MSNLSLLQIILLYWVKWFHIKWYILSSVYVNQLQSFLDPNNAMTDGIGPTRLMVHYAKHAVNRSSVRPSIYFLCQCLKGDKGSGLVEMRNFISQAFSLMDPVPEKHPIGILK